LHVIGNKALLDYFIEYVTGVGVVVRQTEMKGLMSRFRLSS
jgi:hypothetical protein